jgi:hypothetical protein
MRYDARVSDPTGSAGGTTRAVLRVVADAEQPSKPPLDPLPGVFSDFSEQSSRELASSGGDCGNDDRLHRQSARDMPERSPSRIFRVPPNVDGSRKGGKYLVSLLITYYVRIRPSGVYRDHDYRAVRVGASGHELHLGSIDGSVTRVPDTCANREAFGSTGTADDSAPTPATSGHLPGARVMFQALTVATQRPRWSPSGKKRGSPGISPGEPLPLAA